MRISSWASLAVALVAMGASAAACSTTNNNGPGSGNGVEGDSCVRTSDCSNDLHSIADVCAKVAGSGDGGTGSSGASSSGASSSGGSSGASSTGGSSTGGGSTSSGGGAAAHLGARGDACQSTSDCASGLACIPFTVGTRSGGVCDATSYGLATAAMGKTCTGECSTSTDCCEMPVDLQVGANILHNCNDIENLLIGGASCVGLPNGDATPLGIGCFLRQAYCSACTSTTWSCTANRCVYNTPCAGAGGVSFKGCPALSRTSLGLTTTCTNGSCAAAAGSGCAVDADCVGLTFAAPPGTFTGGTCRGPQAGAAGLDCTCHTGSCYLKCAKELDCATGFTCDTMTTHLCKPAGACSTDAQCASQTGDVTAKCTMGACTTPCTVDADCSPPGGLSGLGRFNGRVCIKAAAADPTGTCQATGCTMDADCNVAGGAGNVHMFCVTPASATTTTYWSATTSGM